MRNIIFSFPVQAASNCDAEANRYCMSDFCQRMFLPRRGICATSGLVHTRRKSFERSGDSFKRQDDALGVS